MADGNDFDNQLNGGAGNDVINGLGGNDDIYGFGGSDTLSGGTGDDYIYGGEGSDSLLGGAGEDVFFADAGADYMDGGDGIDMVTYDAALSGLTVDLAGTGSGDIALGDKYVSVEIVIGSKYNDSIIGDDFANFLLGGLGSDTLNGAGGDDLIDTGAGIDLVDGGDGIDWLSIDRSASMASINFDARLMGSGLTIADGTKITNVELLGVLYTGSGNDVLTVTPNNGSFVWYASGGNDRLVVDYSSRTVTLNGFFGLGTYFIDGYDYNPITDSYRSISYGLENVTILSGSGSDNIAGGYGNDSISGGAGNDWIYGGDWSVGSSGNDTLIGGDGNDFIEAGNDFDIIDGGSGVDTLSLARFSGTSGINLDAVLMGTSSGVVLNDGTSISNMELLSEFKTTAYDDYLKASAAQGAFKWYAYGGSDTLEFDFSSIAFGFSIMNSMGTLNIQGTVTEAEPGRYSVSAYDVENMIIRGGLGNDTIAGGSGNDLIQGGAGYDYLSGSLGNDTLYGGDNFDRLVLDYGVDVIDGGADIDELIIDALGATEAINFDISLMGSGFTLSNGTVIANIETLGENINTGSGDDVIKGGELLGAFRWQAGLGTDTFVADYSKIQGIRITAFSSSYDFLVGNKSGSLSNVEWVIITGGYGSDEFLLDNNSVFKFASSGSINGGSGADHFVLGDYAYEINGGAGNDNLSINQREATSAVVLDLRLMATENGAVLSNGSKISNIERLMDVVTAGGDDTLMVSSDQGAFNWYAEGGVDALVADYSKVADSVLVRLNKDFNLFSIQSANVVAKAFNIERVNITSGSGNDQLSGLDGNDILSAGIGNDMLIGGAGNDTLNGGLGADSIDGGAGFDVASYMDATSGLTAFLGASSLNSGSAAGDSFANIEGIIGSSFGDILWGTRYANSVDGGVGNDWLYGQDGADTILGGAGSDVISGGLGADSLDGGAGKDVAFYRDATSSVYNAATDGAKADMVDGHTYGISIDVANVANGFGEANGDTLTNIENIWGSNFDDIIRGSDSLGGQVYGFWGNDLLDGRGGNDVFYGGVGSDTIITGAGADDIYYKSYHDQRNAFGTLEPFEGGDTITDFEHGVDHVTVSRYWFGFGNINGVAQSLTSQYADFITSGTTAISTKPTFFYDQATGQLMFDPDGTGKGAAVLMVTFSNNVNLTLSDIWTA